MFPSKCYLKYRVVAGVHVTEAEDEAAEGSGRSALATPAPPSSTEGRACFFSFCSLANWVHCCRLRGQAPKRGPSQRRCARMTSPVEACMLILERSVWVRKEQQTLQAAMCGGSWTTRGNCGPLAADEPGHEPGAGVVLGIRRVYLVQTHAKPYNPKPITWSGRWWPHSHHGPPAGGWPAPAGGDCEHPGTGSSGLHKSYINSDAGKIQPSQG